MRKQVMQRKIPCHHCDGTGAIPLPDHLADTLDEVHGEITSLDLQKKFPSTTQNAKSNYLEALRKLGFLARRRRGKWWVYRKLQNGKKAH